MGQVRRAAAAGGVVASFSGQYGLADGRLREQVRRVREPYLAEDDIRSPDGTPPDAPLQWPGTEMRDCTLFTAVRQTVVARRVVLTADGFVGHLSTVSAYLMLPAGDRSQVLGRIRSVLPDRVDIAGDLTAHLACRA